MTDYFFLVTLLPLIGFFINLFFGKKINSEKVSGWISSILVFIPFLFGVYALLDLISLEPESRKIFLNYFSWIVAGNLSVNYSFLIDPLSVAMVLVVTGVGFIIHVYSIGYMHGDKAYARYFAYLNLFIFAMLNLVLADNFLLVFLGWEGVGICSYLLIGFWFEKKFTGDAAKKAFVVNRIGDFGFMVAMFIIFAHFGTLEISNFLEQISGFSVGDSLLITISLLFFLGATGKSAQIPLFVWLPDAMAGPTPVSALIHAATMVTAGVYFVARCSLLYALSPISTNVILVVGILTALMAATIALKQNDIKKILAYSTISQLGFMFIALGTFSYTVAIFHLITHAFFKGLLFLGSGSVIHSMQDEQDITKMGGLRKKMKITFITFFIGSLAISGIPPFAGFFSKDEILYKVFAHIGIPVYLIVLLTAAITAFYMFRLVALTFYGKPRYATENIKPHESPRVMTVPLIILAVLSTTGGFIGLPHILHLPHLLESWFEPVFIDAKTIAAAISPETLYPIETGLLIIVLSIIVAAVSMLISFKIFIRRETFPPARGFGKVLANKYYVDEVYDSAVVEPVKSVSDKFLWNIFDNKIIDGLVNGVADYVTKLSVDWRKIQTGVIQDYATFTIIGIIAIIIYLLLL
jgi:NADH-quinone oxidoreductase subunit L